MSEEIKEIEEVSAISIQLNDEEIKIIESLITTTKYPHEFIEELSKKEELTSERKLVLMYHFAQGHMYSAIHQFMQSALPQMMGMESVDPGLEV
tara:strand:- start:46 stop:327 length:282 start_codon:yes stop_codon:yes gene_type:complete